MRSWYVRRLRAMSWGERRLRAARRMRDLRHGRRFARTGAEAVAGPPPSPDAFLSTWTSSPWVLSPERLADLAGRWPQTWTRRTVEEAEEIMAGRYRWLGAVHDLGPRPRWRAETVSRLEFPAAHWITLAPASPRGDYDLKHLWEPNLHGAFVTLAKAHLLTGEERYRDHLRLLWRDWLTQNPPLCGPNYLAPVEIGLRLIHWAAALRFLAARRVPDSGFLTEVFRDVHFQRFTIADNLSRYSSANNHLLGELASLALVDAAFPGLAPAARTDGYDAELQREIRLQFHPDGGNREQAFHYHAFSLAFALLVAAVRRAEDRPWPSDVQRRLRAAVRFLDAGLDRRHQPFLYGDSDESEVLPLAEGERHLYLPLLAQAQALFAADGDGSDPVGHIPLEGDERTAWLAGEIAWPNSPARAVRPEASTAIFPDCGQAWLREGPLEVHLNAGELGYLSIAAHAHADALSVQVRFRGEPIIVDPGTFSYRGDNPYREWLVGTSAHPTLAVDGADQAERLGPFLWGRRYRARILADPPLPAASPAVAGEHDGYGTRGVVHRRRVSLAGPGTVRITDELLGAGPHRVDLVWPFGPGAVRSDPEGAVFETPGVTARLRLEGLPGGGRLLHGDPAAGRPPWVSRGYDEIECGIIYLWSGSIDLPARFSTVIELTEKAAGG